MTPNSAAEAFEHLVRDPSNSKALQSLSARLHPSPRITLAIPVVGDHQWHGGVVYVQLLATAIRSLPRERQPGLVFLLRQGEEASLDLYRPFLHLFDQVLLVGFPPGQELDTAGAPTLRLATFQEAASRFDVMYPLRPNVVPGLPGAAWIPDFQHRHLPRFFSESELRRRDIEHQDIAARAPFCVFSSLDAESDFRSFHPESACRSHVLSFHHNLPAEAFQVATEPVVAKYGLARKFIVCCNQFWIHKGHDTLFRAFARVASEFPDVDLVCTGNTEDYRAAGYFESLVKFLETSGIRSRVKILGLIPREDQLQLLRAAMGVVHPSLFEGWSTVVEDCRSLGKRMVLTDLGVHLEQDPLGAVFFRQGDENDLVAKLRQTLPTWTPGPDPVAEARARQESTANLGRFGQNLLDLCGRILHPQAEDEEALACLEAASKRVGRDPQAVESILDQAPVLESRNAKIHRAAGNLLLRANRLNAARTKFLMASRIAPADPDAHLDLGITWMLLGRHAEADAALRRTLELAPRRGDAWKAMGQLRLQAKDDEAGVEAYRQALELLPDDPECLVLVGVWHARRGDLPQARALLEKAARLRPDDPGIKQELSSLGAGAQAGAESSCARDIFFCANFVPTSDPGWSRRQHDCADAFAGLVAGTRSRLANLRYPDEPSSLPSPWEDLPVLTRSARESIPGGEKRKPFVTDLFDLACTAAERAGLPCFAVLNSDVIPTRELLDRLAKMATDGIESVAVSRTDGALVDGGFRMNRLEYLGFDLFVVSVAAWKRERRHFHEYVFGERAWDDAWTSILLSHTDGRILWEPGLLLHPSHATQWLSGVYNDHNLDLYLGVDIEYALRFRRLHKTAEPLGLGYQSGFDPTAVAREIFRAPLSPNPVTSVVVAGVGDAKLLRRTVDSILATTWEPHFLSVVDSGPECRQVMEGLRRDGFARAIHVLEDPASSKQRQEWIDRFRAQARRSIVVEAGFVAADGDWILPTPAHRSEDRVRELAQWEAKAVDALGADDIHGFSMACGRIVVLSGGDPTALARFEPVLAEIRRRPACRESALAHDLLDGLHGLEIGGSSHNSFGLKTRNVGLLQSGYVAEQIRLCGTWMPIDIECDAATLPVPDESEDFVVSSHVLEHTTDVARTLLDWFRVVRKGGILHIVVPLPGASKADDDKQPITWSHVFEDLVQEASPAMEPEQDSPGSGHYHLLALAGLEEVCSRLFGHRCEVVARQEIDDKVGNGCAIALRKIVSLSESFPWNVHSENGTADLVRRQREAGVSHLDTDDSRKLRHPIESSEPPDDARTDRVAHWNGGWPIAAARGPRIPIALESDPRVDVGRPGWFAKACGSAMADLEGLGIEWVGSPTVGASFDVHAEAARGRSAERDGDWFGVLLSASLIVPRLLALCRQKMTNERDVLLVGSDRIRELDFRGSPVPGNLSPGRFDLVLCRREWWERNAGRFRGMVGGPDLWCAFFRTARVLPVLRAGHLLGLHEDTPASTSSDPLWKAWISSHWDMGVPYKEDAEEFVRKLSMEHAAAPFDPARTTAGKPPSPIPDAVRTASCADPADIVNIGIVTYNRLDFTRRTFEALLPSLDHPHRITVVDNASQDGTGEFLKDLHQRGIIHNLHLLPENLGIAKASNIAWASEPEAGFYLKLDNDMVPLRRNWLSAMVRTARAVPGLAALGCSVEPRSYPAETIGGAVVRPKRDANIGGACFLVPKAVHDKLGWWCEDYGLYGEEDGDFALRIRLAGMFNAYMEDEDAFSHLPGGKAGAIDPRDLSAVDPVELHIHEDYRLWKDDLRRELQKQGGLLQRNVVAYQSGQRSLFVPRGQFQGLLGPDLQVFCRGRAWEFHPTAGTLTEAHRRSVREFAASQSLSGAVTEPDALRPMLSIEERDPKPQAPRTTIVVPVHGHLDLTARCVDAIHRTTDSVTTEIVVVDDASPDGTASWLRGQEASGRLKSVLLPSNRGFAHACNAGAAAASGRILVFLNNDTLPEPGWLEAMVRTLEENPSVGMVGSRLLYPDRTIQHAGIHFHPGGMPFHVHRGSPANDPAVLRAGAFPAVTGACIAMPADLYRKLGGFDESFRMYVEDIDLCLKVWDSGCEVRYCPQSVVVHLESASATDLERRDAMVREGLGKLHTRWAGRWPIRLRQVEGVPPAFFEAQDPAAARVQWISPVWDPSGYADESRAFLKHLAATDLGVSARPWGRHSETFRQAAPEADRAILDGALARDARPGSPVVLAMPAHALGRVPGAGHHVGRTTFETDGLPPDWVARCNAMDEIWVPCAFNKETFAEAGVARPILVVPEGVDTDRFRPGLAPLDLPGPREATTYLAVFEWTHRKSPDLLLQAWATAFTAHDDARLVLRTYPPNQIEGDPAAWVDAKIDEQLARIGKRRSDCAPIAVIARQVPDADMPRLYNSADVYLAPSRGEGWGRPHMEALSCGVAVVATRWSGNLDFQTDDNSWLIDIDGLEEIDAREEFPFYRGQKWAKPSLDHFVELLRESHRNTAVRRAKGERARQDMVEKWDWSKIAPLAELRLREILAEIPAERSELAQTPEAANSVQVAAPLRWAGPVFNYSGYARLARETLKGLMDAGHEVSCDPQLNDKKFFAALSGKDAEIARWKTLLGTQPSKGPLVICDIPRDTKGADILAAISRDNAACDKRVCWTMFETDRLPEGWASALNTMDEVWVPSQFNRNTFARAGVQESKLHVIPGCIDATPYANAVPMSLPGSGYTFLSVFQWIERKGWDVLLDAWSRAFKSTDPVRLALRCHPFGNAAPVSLQLERFLSGRGLRRQDLAPIHLIEEFLPDDALPGLFAASDCFVLPSRGEGWGLPYLESMASGKPVIGTRWSAQTDFLTPDNSWLLSPRDPVPVGDPACREVPFLDTAHRWADPSPDELAKILRHAFEHPQEGRSKGRQGRLDATSRWTPAHTARAIADRLAAHPPAPPGSPRRSARSPISLDPVAQARVSDGIANVAAGIKAAIRIAPASPAATPSTAPDLGQFLSVRWEGSQFVHHSLAHVNREMCLLLAKRGHDLSLVPFEPDQFGAEGDPDLALLAKLHGAPLEGPCQIHVRHQWPPDLKRPAQGRWVVVQPWEFGSPPKQWIPVFSRQIDELWAYTNHVRDMYLEAGVPADKVKVVPLGVDCEKFRPGLAPYPLGTKKRFKFLYVGGTIARKGFDVLLNAWKEAFGPHDDVCLVVKDMGGGSFYKGQTAANWIRELQDSRQYAEIEYIDAELQPSQIPSLYAACDVLVHPYRGEGFGLPIAEAMACGLPCVITRGGAADDFCTESESWGVAARRVPVPGGKVGPFETVSEPWWLEPSVPDLIEKMRAAHSDQDARIEKGEAARTRIVEHFTWDHAATIAEGRLRELSKHSSEATTSKPLRSALSKLAKAPRPGSVQPPPSPDPSASASPIDIELAELNRILFQAEAAAARGDFHEADALSEQAVARFPHQHLAWLARAMILRGLKKFPKASEAISRSLLERETPDALLESIQIHALAGQKPTAKAMEKLLKAKYADWVKETRTAFLARGQAWPLDALKTISSAPKSPAPPRKGKR